MIRFQEKFQLILPSSSGFHDRTFVQLSIRPQFDKIYFNGPLSAVHLRPSNTNDRGLSSETVHEMDARSFWFVVHMDVWTVGTPRMAVFVRGGLI